MTRALFVTVAAHELYMPVEAWRNSMGPAGHITYNSVGVSNDETILACAKGYEPDFIFYIGSHDGTGRPSVETFRELRKIAPSIHYQSDVEDETWFDVLKQYRAENCFDLIVSQTGVKTPLIDMASLMAIDLDAFVGPADKTIHCGFSGSCGALSYIPGVTPWEGRAEILHGLGSSIRVRPRDLGGYEAYVKFLKRCRFMLNTSWTGSQKRHHVKWRVLEAAFADCALLEPAGSPISRWFPKGSYYTYKTSEDVKKILMMHPSESIQVAARFGAHAREHYTPGKIFGNILGGLPK